MRLRRTDTRSHSSRIVCTNKRCIILRPVDLVWSITAEGCWSLEVRRFLNSPTSALWLFHPHAVMSRLPCFPTTKDGPPLSWALLPFSFVEYFQTTSFSSILLDHDLCLAYPFIHSQKDSPSLPSSHCLHHLTARSTHPRRHQPCAGPSSV